MKDLPVHDFENDKSISEKRKEACKIDYVDMQLHHIDKIYTSAFVYDKTTGEPRARKPRSVHELVWFLLQSAMATREEVDMLKERLSQFINEKIKK